MGRYKMGRVAFEAFPLVGWASLGGSVYVGGGGMRIEFELVWYAFAFELNWGR